MHRIRQCSFLHSRRKVHLWAKEEQQQILRAIRGHRRKHEGMEPIEELFYDSDKRSRMCHSCPAQKQCNWTEEEKNMEIEI